MSAEAERTQDARWSPEEEAANVAWTDELRAANTIEATETIPNAYCETCERNVADERDEHEGHDVIDFLCGEITDPLSAFLSKHARVLDVDNGQIMCGCLERFDGPVYWRNHVAVVVRAFVLAARAPSVPAPTAPGAYRTCLFAKDGHVCNRHYDHDGPHRDEAGDEFAFVAAVPAPTGDARLGDVLDSITVQLAAAGHMTVPDLIADRDALRADLHDLCDAFQQVYEAEYGPAPAGENGAYHHARRLLGETP